MHTGIESLAKDCYFILIEEFSTSKRFRDNLDIKGVVHSMGRKGNCWDNAVIESFNRILKLEWLYTLPVIPKNLSEVQLAVFDWRSILQSD